MVTARNVKTFGFAAAALMFGGGTAAQAYELIEAIPDTYVGSDDHNGAYDYNNTDAIGGSAFNIVGATGTRVVVGGTQSGNAVIGGTVTDQVSVSIYMQYSGADFPLTNFGDLFINPTWTPNTSTGCTAQSYPTGADPCDNYATGTQWQFGIAATGLSGSQTSPLAPGSQLSGTGSIYQITNPNQVITSYVNDVTHECNEGSAWIWREGEPVQVATQSYDSTCNPNGTNNSPDGLAHTAAAAVASGDVSWTYTAAPDASTSDPNNPNGLYNVLTYTFNADAIDSILTAEGESDIIGPGGDYDFAMSWAMTCANDIIEAQLDWAPVPEPASWPIYLAGLGMLVAFAARRQPGALS